MNIEDEQDAEDIARMEMPCQCSCRQFFDLNDGHTCDGCYQIFCDGCIEEPFDLCPDCQYLEESEEA